MGVVSTEREGVACCHAWSRRHGRGGDRAQVDGKEDVPSGMDSSQTAIWVADPCAHKVWLLDPRSGEVMDVIEGLGKPIDVDVTGTRAWIVSFRDNLVSVVDVDSFQILAQGRAGHGATAIAAHGREAWVANHEGYSLTHLKLP